MKKEIFKRKKDDSEAVKPKKKFKFFYIFRVLFVIAIIILIYFAFNFFRIFNKKSLKYYEVISGEIVNVDRHTGVIYRDEHVEKCKSNGYINFFVANAKRVNRGAFIYAINDDINLYNKLELNTNDKMLIRQNIKKYVSSITDYNFSNIYTAKNNIDNQINEISIIKQLENINFEKELEAKEKGYAKYAGLISFLIDGYEDTKIESYTKDLYKSINVVNIPKNDDEVKSGESVYKIVSDPTFQIAFDSDYDYDDLKNKFVNIKFVYENLNAKGQISSFIGSDNEKHFSIAIDEYPESFIDKRIVDFEIENKKITGLKIPIKSIVSKNCYIIPKNMLEKDFETDENIFYKLSLNGERERISCNISKEDDMYYYISIDDALSKLKYGDVLTNRYNDTYSLSEVVRLDGVYNLNKGYAVFKNIEVIDKTNEYAIIRSKTQSGVSLYDHIALNASEVKEGDLIAES